MSNLESSRSLGFWRTWALVVGTMIGSGVFMLPAVLAPYGSFAVAGWLIAGTGTLFIALTLGSLARRLPKIGGPYAYAREAFGDLPAFLIAWGYWIAIWAGVAAIAIAFAGYASVFLPALGGVPAAEAAAALGAIWVLTGVNAAGVRTAGIVQLATTLLKLLPLFLLAAAGLIVGDVTAIPATNPHGEPLPLLFAGVAVLTMWAYVGLEAATVPADDVIGPERTIPRALVIGTLTTTAVYVLATLGVMALVPTAELAKSSSPFADAASALFGGWGAKLVAGGAIASILGCLNANILLSGQVPRAAALDGLLPARFEGRNASGAPAFGLVVSTCLASALVAMSFTRGLVAAFTTMILLSTLTTLVPYAVSAAADLVLQRRAAGGRRISRRSAAVAAIALVFSVFAILGAGLEVVGYGTLLLTAGLPVYYWMTHARRTASAEAARRPEAPRQ